MKLAHRLGAWVPASFSSSWTFWTSLRAHYHRYHRHRRPGPNKEPNPTMQGKETKNGETEMGTRTETTENTPLFFTIEFSPSVESKLADLAKASSSSSSRC